MSARPLIAIYGSAQPQPGTPLYEEAREVGRRLAEAGFDVMTGGYDGTMAGASLGAHEGGGHVVGITIDVFPRPANQWVREEVRHPGFAERLRHLTDQAQGFVVLQGGIGTLTEIFYTWGLMQTGAVHPPRPIVVLGAPWRHLFALLQQEEFLISPEHFDLIRWAESPAEVVTHFQTLLQDPEGAAGPPSPS